jgi:hypothetical protein
MSYCELCENWRTVKCVGVLDAGVGVYDHCGVGLALYVAS